MTTGEFVRLALAAVPLALLFYLAFRSNPKPKRAIAEDWPHEPYRVYTGEFDVILQGNDIRKRLEDLSPDAAAGKFERSDLAWNLQVSAAEEFASEAEQQFGGHGHCPAVLTNTAVLVLVDQSGSMRGLPMAWVAGGVRRLCTELCEAGASVQIVGYSTAGWWGGFPRQQWMKDGQPARPGRLCALLHIVYKSFDEAEWGDHSWRAMLDPNILRENIDGETILWAALELRKRPEERKILVIVSDAAPVDDSTLFENGEEFLMRHLVAVVSEVEEANDIDLYAIGVGTPVHSIYAKSTGLNVGENLVSAVWGLIIP